MNNLEVITTDYGDWTVVFLDGKLVYRGHDGYAELVENICRELNINVQIKLISQEEMEEKY